MVVASPRRLRPLLALRQLPEIARARKAPPGSFRIGYKQAFFEKAGHFTGVSGAASPYEVVAEAPRFSPGFHAYSSLEAAEAHEQKGTVLLEVLLSGVVTLKEKGFIATHQRVLQLITTTCTYCTHAATYFSRHRSFVFMCDGHAEQVDRWLRGRYIAPAPHEDAEYVRPIEALPEAYPLFQTHSVFVTTLSDGVVPTRLASV